jgi:hypothetical protein
MGLKFLEERIYVHMLEANACFFYWAFFERDSCSFQGQRHCDTFKQLGGREAA